MGNKMFFWAIESNWCLILGTWGIRWSTGGGELLIDGVFGHLTADRWFMAGWIKVWHHFHNRIYCSNYYTLCSIPHYKTYPKWSFEICQLPKRIKYMAQRRHPTHKGSFPCRGITAWGVQLPSILIPQWRMSLSLTQPPLLKLFQLQPQPMQWISHGQEPNFPTWEQGCQLPSQLAKGQVVTKKVN